MPDDLESIKACVTNDLPSLRSADVRLAAVIGGSPSRYSKSPALWNAAFEMLGLDAAYVPLDVATARLGDLIAAVRRSERFLGVNVTVPHKLEVMRYLDRLDPGAERIQAVNTIVRSAAGSLTGSNTDGAGFQASLLEAQPGAERPFMDSVDGIDAVILGAGGSARAVSFQLAGLIGNGDLVICNRTRENAARLIEDLRSTGANARFVAEPELPGTARNAGIIVNCTIKGQSGGRIAVGGGFADAEEYSALASAGGGPTGEADRERNQRVSLELCAAIPVQTVFYDLIYSPQETLFLRHARLTGHRTMNGKAMIICQAALALFHHLARAPLERERQHTPGTYRRILETMYRAW